MIDQFSLEALAAELKAELIGNNVMFSQLSTDTRTLQAGAAYLALRGENFDGHEFAKAAEQAGAAAIIAERALDTSLPQLVVGDTHAALGSVARLNRQRSKAKVVALTGSQGKTTVKEMAASILASKATTLATESNLNNTIGVPLTLLRLEKKHHFAVIEMGANAAGEIAFSASVTCPDVALITSANAAHVEGFGSLDGIVEAKGEILDFLGEEGVAVLNADDPNVERWLDRASYCKRLTFSANGRSQANFRASGISLNDRGQASFILHSPQGDMAVELSLVGKHNVSNALAAAAVAMEAGAALEHVKRGLESVKPVPGRLISLAGLQGAIVIDDSYNASPASVLAAIDVLAQQTRHKILIVGDMKELGEEAEQSHAEIGEYAARLGIDDLFAVGDFAGTVVAAFGEKGLRFSNKDELIEHAREKMNANVVVLVKGSRGARMESVVSGLRAEGED